MPYAPVQPLAATAALGQPQMQMRNRIAMQLMGRPGMTAARPAVMPPQLRSYTDPNQQAMQQQRALQLQQQQALGGIFDPGIR